MSGGGPHSPSGLGRRRKALQIICSETAAHAHGVVVGFLTVPSICWSKQALEAEEFLRKGGLELQSMVPVNVAFLENKILYSSQDEGITGLGWALIQYN